MKQMKYPRKVFFTTSPELYERIQMYGFEEAGTLINNLLADYFEKNDR